MKLCKNCIHYCVCNKFTAPNESYPEVGGCKCYETPSDEVARLQSQINRLKKYDEERDIALHARLISNAKTEAAREIFEEIDKGFAEMYPYYSLQSMLKYIAELKKKYTEGEE